MNIPQFCGMILPWVLMVYGSNTNPNIPWKSISITLLVILCYFRLIVTTLYYFAVRKISSGVDGSILNVFFQGVCGFIICEHQVAVTSTLSSILLALCLPPRGKKH